jgi:hypothetical protein
MKITEQIARHIIEVHDGDNWTEVNLKDTLSDVSVLEARTRTVASANTIASLLQHLTYWNRVMIKRIRGINVEIPESNGFDVAVLDSEEEWENLKADSLRSAHELAEAVRSFPDHQLESPMLPGHSTAYKNLQGTSEHVHYHLGQIVILKQLIRSAGSLGAK